MITLYNDDPAVTVTVIDGPPPVDQTVLVASLTAQVAALTAEVATLTVERDTATAKIAAALAALA
jgi:hypothetical protein